jgi:hypothetical protein
MYTAIAGQFESHEEARDFTEQIQKLSSSYSYKVIVNNSDFDDEVSEGVKIFQEKMGINLLLCLNYPSHKRVKISLDLIFLELGYPPEPKYAGKQTDFLDLILKVSFLSGPLKLYWVFASEWPKDRFVRLKSGSAVDLIAYLKGNNWYWSEELYDIERDSYHNEYEIPLLFHITS